MEIQGHLLHRAHRHVLGQVVVQSRQQPLGGDGALCFQADTELPGVYAGVRAGAGLDVLGEAGDFAQGLLEHLLHRQGVFLDLPAVVGGAVVRQLDEEIPLHRPPHTPRPTAGTRRLRAINAPKATALRSSTSQSPWPKWNCFILVRPSPPW